MLAADRDVSSPRSDTSGNGSSLGVHRVRHMKLPARPLLHLNRHVRAACFLRAAVIECAATELVQLCQYEVKHQLTEYEPPVPRQPVDLEDAMIQFGDIDDSLHGSSVRVRHDVI